MRKLAVLAVGSAMAFAATATEWYWVQGSTDWTSPSSYTNATGGAGVPQSGDEVAIPKDVTAVLKFSDTANWAVANALARVRPLTTTSFFEIHVDGTDEATFNPKINFDGTSGYSSWYLGGLVKKGTGTLTLGSGSGAADYFTDITVDEGTLKLPQNISGWSWRWYDLITVRKGATLFTCRAGTGAAGMTNPLGLVGEGIVTNDTDLATGCSFLEILGSGRIWSHEFAGELTGNIKLQNGRTGFCLTGVNNTFKVSNSVEYNYGSIAATRDLEASPLPSVGNVYIGLKKIGKKGGEPSSAGCAEKLHTADNRAYKNDAGGTGYLYLGEGEETDKDIIINKTADAYDFFDAGLFGGITFTGTLMMGPAAQQRFVITGSNTVNECVVRGKIAQKEGCNWRIIKKGPGIWRFTDVTGTEMAGVFAVEDGTLRYDSIAEAGKLCSLGTATALYEDYYGAPDPTKAVAHAFELGSADDAAADPVFEYTGTGDGWAYGRPIALKGSARLRHSGSGELRLVGLKPLDGATGAKTLTLDGAGENATLYNVEDPDGNISLVKDGTGTWTVEGTNTISGSVAVKGGTLRIMSETPFTWFRYTEKENFSMWKTLIHELCLFAADGSRQNGGLTYNSTAAISLATIKTLKPGEFAFSCESAADVPANSVNMFDGDAAVGWETAFRPKGESSWVRPTIDKPENWFSFIMRLPEGAKEVTSYDQIGVTYYWGDACPRAFLLEGSVDGVNWVLLHDCDLGATVPAGNYSYQWRLGGETYGSAPDVSNHTTGRPITARVTGAPFRDVTEISVAKGATLAVVGKPVQLKSGVKLKVDGTLGGGTLSNLVLPEDGTLDVTNLPKFSGSLDIAIARENVSGFENVASWTLMADGAPVPATKMECVVTDDGIRLIKSGLILLFR